MKRTCKLCGHEFETDSTFVLCEDCRYRKCVICGKEFRLVAPYKKITCSKTCAGIYRKQTGISKQAAQKAAATMLGRYGVSNPSKVSGPKHTKICKLCGKEFMPTSFRQEYCSDVHYGPCPVCGKPVEIKDYNIGPQCCSEECRIQRIKQTCIAKYGNECVLNSDYGLEKRKTTCMEKYGADSFLASEQGQDTYKSVMLSKYGVEHPLQSSDIMAKMKQTNLQRYGTEYVMSSEQVKAKARQTAYEHGGIGFANPEIRERIYNTTVQKYGVINPMQNETIKKKAQDTCIQRYGAPSVLYTGTPIRQRIETNNLLKYGRRSATTVESLEKYQQTMLAKYGVTNPMYLAEFREKSQKNLTAVMVSKYGKPYSAQIDSIKQKISNTFMDKYGVPWYCMTSECQQNNSVRVSLPNKLFALRLEAIPISYMYEYYIGKKAYDLYLPASNMLIEIDPTYTHNAIGNHWDHQGMSSTYHADKSKLAEEHGYTCIHIFDWDNWEKIIHLLKPKLTLYARNGVIHEVPEAECNDFLNKYHLQGTVRGQVCRYGLYYADELIMVMTFGKPRYNKNYQWELLRLCTHSDYRVIGGASKLYTHFLQELLPESIISYCDRAKFSGAVYKAMGMTLDHISAPAKHWSKSIEHITDNLLRQRGYDQLFGTSYGKGTSNEQLMLEAGWLPVYDCGQAAYVWHK